MMKARGGMDNGLLTKCPLLMGKINGGQVAVTEEVTWLLMTEKLA